MFTDHNNDTIAAIATAPGVGGISVIRLSGMRAFALAERVVRPAGRIAVSESHRAYHGKVVDAQERPIDEVVATVFRGPHSYTGEDVVEISCHGGAFVARRILETILAAGARGAEPGEFTKRAFLNRRIDLSQAEAVADIIHADSDRALSNSLMQLDGALSARVKNLSDEIVGLLGLLELELDFVEEGYEFSDKKQARKKIESIIDVIDRLQATYVIGKYLRDGVKVVLAGAPNVGKSSLLNALLGRERAIVTEVPGTTRDTIEENIMIDGILLKLVDTAGVRTTSDIVEKEGVSRTIRETKNADVVLLLYDLTRPVSTWDREIEYSLLNSIKERSIPMIVCLNKCDVSQQTENQYVTQISELESYPHISISAKTGKGLDALFEMLKSTIVQGSSTTESITITNARHYSALIRCRKALQKADATLVSKLSGEFVAVDLRAGLEALGEITGAVTNDDILNSIFSKFCIGK